MPILWPLLVLVGISHGLTFGKFGDFIDKIHTGLTLLIIAASGVIQEQQNNSRAIRCEGQNLGSLGHQISCPSYQFGVPSPSFTFGGWFADLGKTLPYVFGGLLVGVAVRLAWNHLNPKHKIESDDIG